MKTDKLIRRDLFKLSDLREMNRSELEADLKNIRRAVRYCRDQKGDDRCWLDYYVIYATVPGIPTLAELPCRVKFMGHCAVFVLFQDYSVPNVLWVESRPQHDYDIPRMSDSELFWDVVSWRKLIWRDYIKHVHDAKTVEDTIRLYDKLPDRVVYDMRLPDGMLANCEKFYQCKVKQAKYHTLKLHEW